MSLSLVDELTQKQAPKFQLNEFNKESIDKALAENEEGIFNLSHKISEEIKSNIINYITLTTIYSNYETEVNKTPVNYEIMFKKRLSKVIN